MPHFLSDHFGTKAECLLAWRMSFSSKARERLDHSLGTRQPGFFQRCKGWGDRLSAIHLARKVQRIAGFDSVGSLVWIMSWSSFDTGWKFQLISRQSVGIGLEVLLGRGRGLFRSACTTRATCSYELLSNDSHSVVWLSAQMPEPLHNGSINSQRYSSIPASSPYLNYACSVCWVLMSELGVLRCQDCRRSAPQGKSLGSPKISDARHPCFAPCAALARTKSPTRSNSQADLSCVRCVQARAWHNDTVGIDHHSCQVNNCNDSKFAFFSQEAQVMKTGHLLSQVSLH